MLIDMPTLMEPETGRLAHLIWKYCWQIATSRRAIDERDARIRPVALYADEAHWHISPLDEQFFATARGNRACGIYLTQDMSGMLSQMPREALYSLMAKFTTRIIHANSDHSTNEWAKQMIGQETMYRYAMSRGSSEQYSRTDNRGKGNVRDRFFFHHWRHYQENKGYSRTQGGGSSEGDSYTEYRDYPVPAEFFIGGLRTGGRENRRIVEYRLR